MPRGEKRPAEVIATGEEIRNAAAKLGSRGGKARAARMSPERRSEIAREAARRRWRKDVDQGLKV